MKVMPLETAMFLEIVKSRIKEEQQAPVVVKIPVSGQCKSMFLKRWSWCEWVGERRLRRTSITAAH